MGVTYFKGNSNIGNISMTESIENNLVSYIDWGFLELGAFFNIEVPSSGAFGGDRHQLRPVEDPRFNDGQVWEGYRQNWVWESGLGISSTQPISISGVLVDNSFIPRSSGYYINYKNGQVIFDEAISTNSDVELSYSHKWINVVGAAEVPWFRTGQINSFRVDDSNFSVGSGSWGELAETRLQLPLIAVEVVDKVYAGYQLGGGQWARGQVILHVLSENPQTTKRISSILSEQNESTIFMFDSDLLASENRYPLDYRGELSESPLCYPNLIAATGDGGFRYTSRVQNGKLRIFSTHEQNHSRISNNIYHSTVRWGTEVILGEI